MFLLNCSLQIFIIIIFLRFTVNSLSIIFYCWKCYLILLLLVWSFFIWYLYLINFVWLVLFWELFLSLFFLWHVLHPTASCLYWIFGMNKLWYDMIYDMMCWQFFAYRCSVSGGTVALFVQPRLVLHLWGKHIINWILNVISCPSIR
jgi:hypothetical protein